MTHSFPTRRLSDLQAHFELPCTAFVLVGDPSECVVPDESIDELRRRLRGLDGTRHSAVSAAQAIRHLDVAHVADGAHVRNPPLEILHHCRADRLGHDYPGSYEDRDVTSLTHPFRAPPRNQHT